MENAGEELTGSYLKWVLDCDFVEYNLNTRFVQGEIDVVGINLSKKTVYLCEVATHLETGLQYTKNKRPDNVDRFVKKFEKDIEYAKRFFQDYDKVFMLWSPIVKSGKKESMYNQMNDLQKIQDTIKQKFSTDIQIIVNDEYLQCINKLRVVAKKKTEAMNTTIMRFLQIDEKTKAYAWRNKRT